MTMKLETIALEFELWYCEWKMCLVDLILFGICFRITLNQRYHSQVSAQVKHVAYKR